MGSSELEMDYQESGRRLAAHNVLECDNVCACNKNIVSAPKWLPCMNACVCVLYVTVHDCICSLCVHCIHTNVCVPLYSAN